MWPLFFFVAVCGIRNALAGSAIDLTHDITEDSLSWVGQQPFTFTRVTTADSEAEDWYAMNEFCVSEHSGTHLDAPYHFWREGWRLGDISLERLIVPGIVIDVSKDAMGNPDFEALPSHIEAFESVHGPLSERGPRVVVLFKFGWSQFFHNRTAYFGTDGNDTALLHFPGVSEAAARRLVSSGNVVGVGVDSPSVDRGQNDGRYRTHRVLAEANIYNLENVAFNTSDLPDTGFTLFVMPMKIAKGTGAPCRIVAVID